MVRPKHSREADPSDTSHLQSPPPLKPRGKSNKKRDYGDHSSTYWAPGWNYERLSKAGHEELKSLPETELLKIQAGMREVLGEDGVSRWSNMLFEEEMKGNPDYQDPLLVIPPNFVSQWQKRYNGQEWGFVAFRTTCYDDEKRWQRFKEQWDEKLDRYFDFFEGAPGVEEAKAKFGIHWIEDAHIDGADIDQLRQRYTTLSTTISSAQHGPSFLNVTSEVMDSVLDNDEDEDDLTYRAWRQDVPFVMVVSEQPSIRVLEEDEEVNEWYRPTFKVAMDSLIDEFWVEVDVREWEKLTVALEESTIWWSSAPSPARIRKRRRIQA